MPEWSNGVVLKTTVSERAPGVRIPLPPPEVSIIGRLESLLWDTIVVMADIFTKEKRNEIMSLIRSKNTKPELALRKLISSSLYPLGYRYRIHYKKVPGSPDVVFVSKKVAVFVDGSFWHGYKLKKSGKSVPKKYWLPKIERNIQRDREVNRKLKKLGWTVIRVWEHDLKKNPSKVLEAIRTALK